MPNQTEKDGLHNQIITKTATRFFKAYGITRKGKSRTFLDDHDWYTTIIEFQPSGFDKGTFLNVGVNFHWFEHDYLSFDLGYRESAFVAFVDSETFRIEVENLCQIAIQKTLKYRKHFETLESAKQTICDDAFASDSLWGNYHQGTISGLTGDYTTMKRYYGILLKTDHHAAWANQLKEHVISLLDGLDTLSAFRLEIGKIATKTRLLKKLPHRDITL